MATTATNDPSDGSEDVTDFLRRIKELGERRDREDAERTRKLEEDILEGRRQREARRAERARSLSPEKQSPSGTPRSPRLSKPSIRSDLASASISSSPTPRLSTSIGDMLDKSRGQEEIEKSRIETPIRTESPLHAIEKPDKAPRASPGLGLSPAWQQRSGSLRGVRGRPEGLVNQVPSPQASGGSTPDPVRISRDSISNNLSSKDPSWFRQTPDRGIGSAAYRQNQDEKEEDTHAGQRRRMLPGMSRDFGQNDEEQRSPRPMGDVQSPAESINEALPVNNSSAYTPTRTGSGLMGRKSPLLSQASQRVVASPSKDLSTQDRPTPRSTTASPVLKHDLSEQHDRPISPTKGMGGFVQSATLKRSDSVNKRWSVQTPSGLSRQNSNANLQTGLVGTRDGGLEAPTLTPRPEPEYRSTAGMSSATPKTSPPRDLGRSEDESTERNTVEYQRPETPPPTANGKEDRDEEVTSPPSPSKRWSPVKSSWLESALSRPSSPKLTPSSPQPSWMSELSRNKQQRSGRDANSKIENEGTIRLIRPESPAYMTSIGIDARPDNPTTKNPPTKPKPSSLLKKSAPDLVSLTDEIGTLPTEDGQLPNTDGQRLLDRTPSITKAKPERPSKKDFRPNLKPPVGSSDAAKKGELEFQNAFGKLRRTHTEKHAAPNPLKDNILRGKAALSMTEGPQSSDRKDEQKETLLRQRNALKATSGDSDDLNQQSATVSRGLGITRPEALGHKKAALESNSSSGNILGPSNNEEAANAENKEEKRQDSITPVMSPFGGRVEAPTSSNLADRFIPALANVLAKGPPSAANGVSGRKLSPRTTRVGDNAGKGEVGATNSSEPLQHMTKSRARGPKRRLPNAEVEVTISQPQALPTRAALFPPSIRGSSLREVTASLITPIKDRTPPAAEKQAKPQTPPKPVDFVIKSESPKGLETVSTRPGPRSPLSPPLPLRPVKPSGLRSSLDSTFDIVDPPTELHSNEQERSESNGHTSEISVKDVGASWGRQTASKPSFASGPKAQIKLPTRDDEQALAQNAGLNRGEKTENGHTQVDLAPGKSIPASTPRVSAQEQPIVSLKTTKSTPPKVGLKPSLTVTGASDISSSGSRSELPESQAIGRYFNSFFKEAPTSDTKLDVDTQAILSAGQAGPSKIKKLRMHISKLSSDGKSTPLPTHQDHVLFDNSVYLCTHVFGDATGARITEVYLWAGDSITEAALEDAQVFARKAAKDCGGKLVIFRRGKETSNFFQALGGILITRSGSAQHSNTPYMLCGRRHLGHLAFDEVQLSTASLCSAFPFIIASSSNIIFLWKGSGCNAEELAGARLMSMDLGISGRVVEIDEGEENPDFFAAFPAPSDKQISPSANHWKLKAKNNNYNVRLFRVERLANQESYTMTALWNRVRRPSQPDNAPLRTEITEIIPFCQADIEPENIYLLDAFFELYIILGPLARSKADAFAAALLFAQDYAILAASSSAEDRPYVPRGTVVLEGMPRDVKVVFRHWEEGKMSTGALMAGRVRSGAGLKVVALNEAIAAMAG